MSSAPISSSARAQSIDSAIEGGFFRSSSRTMWTISTSRRARLLVELGGVQADDLELALDVGVVEPEVEAAALERLGQLARVVGGEQRRAAGCVASITPELGDRDLEVGEDLEQHRLELLVGLVDLVDQQDDGLVRGDRLEQRPREQELLAEDVAARRLPAPRPSASPRPRPGSAAAACGSSTRRAPWPRRGPRSTGGGSASRPVWRGERLRELGLADARRGPRPGPACRAAGRGRRRAPPTRRPGSRPRRGRRGPRRPNRVRLGCAMGR